MLGVGLGLTTLRGRAVGFSPADIAGLKGWWDASDTSTITESGGFVSQLDDKSGNGLHMVEATASDQPLTGFDTVNGLNVLYYDGSDYMATLDAYAATSGAAFTMVGVFEHISEDSLLFSFNNNNGYAYPYDSDSTSTTLSLGVTSLSLRIDGADENPPRRIDIYNLISGKTSVVTVRFNWSSSGTYDISPFSYGTEGNQSVMNFCEAAVYSRQLSGDDLAAVESYLAAKWGVTLA